MKIVERVSFGPIALDLTVVADVPRGAQHCEVNELVCRRGRIEYLSELYCLRRQRRPNIRGC